MDDNIGKVSIDDLDNEILKFSLSMYNNSLLSRKAVDEVMNQFHSFISSYFIPCIQTQVKNELKSFMDGEIYNRVQFILESNKFVFNKYLLEPNRFKLYAKRSLFVAPEQYEIGETPIFDPIKNRVCMRKVYGSCVSLPDTLKLVLEKPGIYEQMFNYTQELKSLDKNILSNIVQGEIYAKCTVNYSNKVVFPLFGHYDEFEVGSSLGSHRGEQKLGGFYVSLASLPPHLRAKLENVFVSSVFHAKHLKNEDLGNKKCFRVTIEDLNSLAREGIEIQFNSRAIKVYFICILIIGDNLGLNSILGFAESFTATHYCRICTAENRICETLVREVKSLLRTPELYKTHVVINDPKSTGVKEQCVFNSEPIFHACINYCVDVMHDFWGGGAKYTVTAILNALVNSKILSLNIINSRINTFNYGDLEVANKPRQIYYEGAKLKVKQSASEMLCLTRYLGLILGDLVPRDNEHWKLYKYLREICHYVMAPRLGKGEIIYLGELIQKHNENYLKLYGKLKPKMHLWVHYVSVMLLNGPVVHYSAFTLERKNKKLRDIALGTTCNINLPHTITLRHQLQLSYSFEFSPAMVNDVIQGPIDQYNADELLRIFIPQILNQSVCKTLKYFEILNKRFSKSTVFISHVDHDGPHFSLIKEIFLIKNNIFIVSRKITINYFDEHYYAFQVSIKVGEYKLIEAKNIPRCPPCLLIHKNNLEYVTNRYFV